MVVVATVADVLQSLVSSDDVVVVVAVVVMVVCSGEEQGRRKREEREKIWVGVLDLGCAAGGCCGRFRGGLCG